MSVFERITKEIPLGMEMHTPVEKKPFRINFIDMEKKMVYFSAGKELEQIRVGVKTPIGIPDCCFDGIPNFLRNGCWVKIGTNRGPAPIDSLQDYIDTFHSKGKTRTADANYVAVVLEHLKIVEVDPNRPSKVRLKQKKTLPSTEK